MRLKANNLRAPTEVIDDEAKDVFYHRENNKHHFAYDMKVVCDDLSAHVDSGHLLGTSTTTA